MLGIQKTQKLTKSFIIRSLKVSRDNFFPENYIIEIGVF